MKLFIVLTLIACSYADKLDRTYLPPANAATAGGSPGSINAPGIDPEPLIGQGLPTSFTQSYRPTDKASATFGNEPNAKPAFAQSSGLPTISGPSSTYQAGNGINGLSEPTSTFAHSPIPAQNFGFNSIANQAGNYQETGVPELNFNQQKYTPERAQAAADRNSEILRNVNENDGETFSYSFETSNGISAEESGVAINGVKAQGGFSYTGDDGNGYSITYTADENGYLPQGEHLPTPHPIPEEILKSIEENAKAAAAGNQEGAYRPEEYESENNPQEYNSGISINQGQGPDTNSAQGQSTLYNSRKPMNQGQKQQELSGQDNRVTTNALPKKPDQETNQFIAGSRPQQAQFIQYPESSGSLDNISLNKKTDQTNNQGFGQQDKVQGSNGYNYNRPEASPFSQGSFGQQSPQSVSESQTNLPSSSIGLPSPYRPASNNQSPALEVTPNSQYQSSAKQPSFGSVKPISQSLPSDPASQGLGAKDPSRPFYKPTQYQQSFEINRPQQGTPQYKPLNENFGSSPSTQTGETGALDTSSSPQGYQYKLPSQSVFSPLSQTSTQYNPGQSLTSASQDLFENNRPVQSSLTSTSPNRTPSQYGRPSQPTLTSQPLASSQYNRPSQSSLTPSSQTPNTYQFNRPTQSFLTSPSQTLSQYNRPGQSSSTHQQSTSQNLSPSQAPYQYNHPGQSLLMSRPQASSQYNRPGQSSPTSISQNLISSQAPYQYIRPGQSTLATTSKAPNPNQVFSQYNRPAQTPNSKPSEISTQYNPNPFSLTSSQSSGPSQSQYQYGRPAQSSFSSPSSQTPSQYNPSQAPPTYSQGTSPPQVSSQYNRPTQSSLPFPSSQTPSQYNPSQSSLTFSQSSSPSQSPYQYNRPVQSPFTSSSQTPSQYNPSQSFSTSSQSSSPSRLPSQYNRPAQSSLSSPTQYKPGQSSLLSSQSSSPSQGPSQYNRPAQSLLTYPSKTSSQYNSGQSTLTLPQSASPSQTPYNYKRPAQSLTASAFQRPSGNNLAPQTLDGSEGFKAKPEQFGGPRQPPSYSPEEGYKY